MSDTAPITASPKRGKRRSAGLSAWAKGVKADLLGRNDFAPHELVCFERALTWFDLSDRLVLEAEGLIGRERDAKLKAAGDAATTALRHWRTLKFVDPSRPERRPGRPSDTAWSAQRRAGGAATHVQTIGMRGA